MKRILGLDLGSNSIGWALLHIENNEKDEETFSNGNIIAAGSRVVPMSPELLGNFDKGNEVSQTKDRTDARSMRRRLERFKLRRERLNRVLTILGFLPKHYSDTLNRYGKPTEENSQSIAWTIDSTGKPAFLFQSSFEEMVALFKARHVPCQKIPYDWTLYYLRSKALHSSISKEELAWVLHSFNHKRGYKESRDDVANEDTGKKETFYHAQVVAVSVTDEMSRGMRYFEITLQPDDKGVAPIKYRMLAKERPELEGLWRDVIVTETTNKKREPSVRMPAADDWGLVKARTESILREKKKHVGEYIFEALLQNPEEKIRGGLVNVIDRDFYKRELTAILKEQTKHHPQLGDSTLYKECIDALYPSNEGRRNNIARWSFGDLLVGDVIFYQRPLRSKKSTIAECPYETRTHRDADGHEVSVGIKCIPVSHPHFQEFRLWQFVDNLRIYDKETDQQVCLSEEQQAALYQWLNQRGSVKQDALLKQLYGKKNYARYRWNYVEDKEYPANATHSTLLSAFAKAGVAADVLTDDVEQRLWHILYSVTDKEELHKALRTFVRKQQLNEELVNTLVSAKPFKRDYGAYSDKAIRRLLPLMRRGKYWSAESIEPFTRQRIAHLISGEEDEGIALRTREKVAERGLQDDLSQYRGLPLWLACYVVYDRHAEAADVTKWESPTELSNFIKSFKQYSLRNPVVEQIVLETLRVTHDVWQKYGHIDEIHLEMARDLKASNEERKRRLQQNQRNEETNMRIRALLFDLMNPDMGVEGIHPGSPMQQDKLRLYEEAAFSDLSKVPDDIKLIRAKYRNVADSAKRPTRQEVERYKLWLDQKYISPYTGKPIPLAKLFTRSYEIEHVIPRSRYFDDSLSNKVICETEVNKLKDKMLGMEFIRALGGSIVSCSVHGKVEVLTEREYEQLVNSQFRDNPTKRRKLLTTELPQGFTQRQLTDSRYIARYLVGVLSNIVREQAADGGLEQESRSKNLIVCTGQVTDRLKHDWGLHEVWSHIIAPRFMRLNAKEGSNRYGEQVEQDGKRFFRINMPVEYQKGFSKKRIDHRHHALDAITIACATRSIVNYLSNYSATGTPRQDLQHQLCVKHREAQGSDYTWLIRKPWPAFTQQVEAVLTQMIVSFKQDRRVLTKTSNVFCRYDKTTGKKRKEHQTLGDHFAVRKSLHKATIFGRVNLQGSRYVPLRKALLQPYRIVDKTLRQHIMQLKKINGYGDKLIEKHFKENTDPRWSCYDFKKVEIRTYSDDPGETPMAAVRKQLDKSFDSKKIKAITDTAIQKILLRHLEENGGNPDIAFSPEGIANMNRDITRLNDGKPHLPILRVRLSETLGMKRPIGLRGNRKSKYAEADKGTNLFFAIYQDENGERSYASIPFIEALERKRQKLPVSSERDEAGNPLLFILSVGDLVYLPTDEERISGHCTIPLDRNRIYKVVSSNKLQCFFVPYAVASPIVPGMEYNSPNKIELTDDGTSIKRYCLPLKTDRLGNVTLRL